MVDERAETGLTFSQCRFGPFAFGDIGENAENTDRIATMAKQGNLAGKDIGVGSVFELDGLFGIHLRLAGFHDQAIPFRGVFGFAAFPNEIENRLAYDVMLALEAPETHELFVTFRENAIAVFEEYRGRNGFEDGFQEILLFAQVRLGPFHLRYIMGNQDGVVSGGAMLRDLPIVPIDPQFERFLRAVMPFEALFEPKLAVFQGLGYPPSGNGLPRD
ncbi:MAG: hypothetical protein MI741_12105, partial [Rhodospirillales bacterium]|nr:hypothetical protein [Rhodospirillales bacterium]